MCSFPHFLSFSDDCTDREELVEDELSQSQNHEEVSEQFDKTIQRMSQLNKDIDQVFEYLSFWKKKFDAAKKSHSAALRG